MNKVEVGKLLTLAAGFDNRKVDRITVEAWASVPELVAADYEDAKAAVIAHQTGPQSGEYLTVGHIVAALRVNGRSTVNAIAADVRSARARGLVGADWDERTPVSADVREALLTLRDLERRAAVERFEFDQLADNPIDPGEIGREVA